MLKIDNYFDVHITKVKLWVIYFTYQGRYFFIRAKREGKNYIWVLYERVCVAENRYLVEKLGYVENESGFVLKLLRPKMGVSGSIHGYNYTQIDIKFFVLSLVKLGLVDGSEWLNLILKDTVSHVEQNNQKIGSLKNRIELIRKENSMLLEFR